MPSAHPSPVRVTLVTHYFPDHRGGVEAVALEIASRLAGSGCASIAWYSSNTDKAPADRPGLRCVPVTAWNFIERGLGFPFPIWSPAALAKLAREVRGSDVIHLHDCLYLPNVVAWAAARLAGRPVIITQHVGWIPYRNPLLRMAMAGANRILGRLLLGSAGQTLFVSDAVLTYFRSFVRFRSPPLRVPNGVDADLFIPADEQQRRSARLSLGVGPDTPLLFFAGRFVEKKGLRLLHRLAQRLPQMRWIFAGWGPLDPAEWKLPNVSVHRGLTKEQLVPLYQAADLFVLPSVGEGFPLAVQEAMACGTPALVGDETAAGYPEAGGLLLHEALGTRDPVERWAARIEALFVPREALPSLRPRVAEFARANWSWERCAARYAEVLQACKP